MGQLMNKGGSIKKISSRHGTEDGHTGVSFVEITLIFAMLDGINAL